MEKFKAIDGEVFKAIYGGKYKISNFGRVLNYKTGRILKARLYKGRDLMVDVVIMGVKTTINVARMVVRFHSDQKLVRYYKIFYKDENHYNAHVDNLIAKRRDGKEEVAEQKYIKNSEFGMNVEKYLDCVKWYKWNKSSENALTKLTDKFNLKYEEVKLLNKKIKLNYTDYQINQMMNARMSTPRI